MMRLELNTFDKGIFPRAAFFNHACKPSAQAFAVDVSEAPAVPMLEVVAIAPIAAGVRTVCRKVQLPRFHFAALLRLRALILRINTLLSIT